MARCLGDRLSQGRSVNNAVRMLMSEVQLVNPSLTWSGEQHP